MNTENSILETNNRIEYLDVFRGLTMIMIIIFHVIGETITTYHHFVDCCGLQVFLFVSGFFYNGFDIKKNVKKLFLPYVSIIVICRIVWNIREGIWFVGQIKQIIIQIMLGYTVDDWWTGQSQYVGIAWFFVFLISSRIIYAVICKIDQGNYFVRGILSLIVTIAGTVIGNYYKTKILWSLDVAMATIIFMYLGDLCSNHKDMFRDFCQKYYIAIVALVAWYFMMRTYGFSELATRTYPNGMTHVSMGVLGITVLLILSCFIYKYIRLLNKPLSFVGKYSMYVLLAHIFDKSCITHSQGINIYLLAIIELGIAFIPLVVIVLYKKLKLKRR